MPSEPPISWPVVFRPESIPVSWSAAPVSTETETDDEDDAEADAGDEHAGQHVGGVAAVRADAGEQQHPGGGDGEAAASGIRTPAWVMTWLPAWTPAPIATANGRNASPVSSAPVPSTFCRYSEDSRKEPNSTAEAASIITKPPPTARSARRWTRSSGWAVRSSSAANAARPASAAAPMPSVCVEVQPLLWA